MGSCCCKYKHATRRSATRTPPSSSLRRADKGIVERNVSSGASSGATVATDTEDRSVLTASACIVLAEGKPLDLSERSDGDDGSTNEGTMGNGVENSNEDEAGDGRFGYLWREPTRTVMRDSASREAVASDAERRPDPEHTEPSERSRAERRPAHIYPPVLFREVRERVEDDGPAENKAADDDQPFFFQRDVFDNKPICPRNSPFRTVPAIHRGFLDRITECSREDDFAAEGDFAYDSDECEARALELMKATAPVSGGNFPEVSSDVAERRASTFMENETDGDREVQDAFRTAAACRKIMGAEDQPPPCEKIGHADIISRNNIPLPAAVPAVIEAFSYPSLSETTEDIQTENGHVK